MMKAILTACALLTVGLVGACTNGVGTGSVGKVNAQGDLSPEIHRQIQAYRQGRDPWLQNVSPDVFLLRRQIFELRHRLIASGQVVETDTRGHRNVIEDLAVEVSLPAPHVCGQVLTVDVTLHNRSQKPMCLLVWGEAFNVHLLHESGRIPRPPPAPARSMRIFVPRPADYRTLASDERFTRKLTLRHLPPNLPPGLYQVAVDYSSWPAGGKPEAIRGSAGGPVQEVRFTLGSDVRGLRGTLQLDEPSAARSGKAPAFVATLKNTADRAIQIQLWMGALIFRDVRTGKEIVFNQTAIEPSNLMSRHPRGYLIRTSYRTLRPGEELTLRIRPLATFDGQRTRSWREVLASGRHYEVRWHYYNDTVWFIEDGRFLQFGNVWMGHLGSKPLPLTLGRLTPP